MIVAGCCRDIVPEDDEILEAEYHWEENEKAMVIIYSATGCARCKVVKGYMNDHDMPFEERDMKADGKEDFKKFYSANRNAIFRGPDGVEFPIYYDGTVIRQSIAAVIAYLMGGEKLDPFFSVGTLHKEWVNGIDVSGGDSENAEGFLNVLRFLKKNDYKLQATTNGKNSKILKAMLDEKLADVVLMEVAGPKEFYNQIIGEEVDFSEIEESIKLTTQFPEYKLSTTVVPVIREDGVASFLTAKEVEATASMIKDATGNMKEPYLLKLWKPGKDVPEQFKAVEPMQQNALLPYRSAARRSQVMTEVEK